MDERAKDADCCLAAWLGLVQRRQKTLPHCRHAHRHTDVNSPRNTFRKRRRQMTDMLKERKGREDVYLPAGLGDSVGMHGSETLSLAVAGAASSWRGKVDCSIAS